MQSSAAFKNLELWNLCYSPGDSLLSDESFYTESLPVDSSCFQDQCWALETEGTEKWALYALLEISSATFKVTETPLPLGAHQADQEDHYFRKHWSLKSFVCKIFWTYRLIWEIIFLLITTWNDSNILDVKITTGLFRFVFAFKITSICFHLVHEYKVIFHLPHLAKSHMLSKFFDM